MMLAIAGTLGCASEERLPVGVDRPITAVAAQMCVEHLDVTAREPMLVEHPSGALFVAGYGRTPATVRQQPRLWKSTDRGATWRRVDVGTLADGAIGNSDVDLAVGPDGTLYFAQMGFDRSAGEGTHVAVGVSHDAGDRWSWQLVSEARFADRPWIVVAPDGTAHLIWNDDSGVRYAVSSTDGRVWSERARIHAAGGSSHLAVGPAGELAVRISPIGASGNRFAANMDLLAVSVDGGRTWTKHVPPGKRTWSPALGASGTLPRWVEPLAWDAEGVLYHLWSEGSRLLLGRSSDHGASWSQWPILSSDEPLYFPYLVARGPGELAATWFSGQGATLAVHAARIDCSQGVAPQVTEVPSLAPDAWVPSEERRRDPAGEYVPIAFLAGGGVAMVIPIQDDDAGRGGFCWRLLEDQR